MYIISSLLSILVILSPVLLVVCLGAIYFLRNRFWFLVVDLFVMVLLIVTIYGAYFERFKIIITDQAIPVGFSAKIAIISDIHLGAHLGVWKGREYLQRVVAQLNTQSDLDAILVAGDWTYYPDKDTMKNLFEPLKLLKFPVYGVLGNHDVEKPGPKIRDELIEALSANSVTMLNNDVRVLPKFNLAGLGDFRNNEDRIDILSTPGLDLKKTIVLTHEPDTTTNFKSNSSPVLTVTGHTHCGQVRTFGLYKFFMPVEDTRFDKGLYDLNEGKGKLWISCGLGEVGLPIRLENPPSIDILTLY
jgi:uncharacterized protein